MIETRKSLSERFRPKSIQAVTASGVNDSFGGAAGGRLTTRARAGLSATSQTKKGPAVSSPPPQDESSLQQLPRLV